MHHMHQYHHSELILIIENVYLCFQMIVCSLRSDGLMWVQAFLHARQIWRLIMQITCKYHVKITAAMAATLVSIPHVKWIHAISLRSDELAYANPYYSES